MSFGGEIKIELQNVKDPIWGINITDVMNIYVLGSGAYNNSDESNELFSKIFFWTTDDITEQLKKDLDIEDFKLHPFESKGKFLNMLFLSLYIKPVKTDKSIVEIYKQIIKFNSENILYLVTKLNEIQYKPKLQYKPQLQWFLMIIKQAFGIDIDHFNSTLNDNEYVTVKETKREIETETEIRTVTNIDTELLIDPKLYNYDYVFTKESNNLSDGRKCIDQLEIILFEQEMEKYPDKWACALYFIELRHISENYNNRHSSVHSSSSSSGHRSITSPEIEDLKSEIKGIDAEIEKAKREQIEAAGNKKKQAVIATKLASLEDERDKKLEILKQLQRGGGNPADDNSDGEEIDEDTAKQMPEPTDISELRDNIKKSFKDIVDILKFISSKNADIKILNKVFHTNTSKSGWGDDIKGITDTTRLDTYNAGKIDIDNIKNVDELSAIYNTIKNDYETLKGPVKVYLKLKGCMTHQKEGNDQQLISKSGEYHITMTDNCLNRLKPLPYKYSSKNGKVGPFSRVYDGKGTCGGDKEENAEFIFNTSVKNTIDNMIGVNNTVLMAYGPSGSGKTFSLIGELGKDRKSDVFGVIKYAIKYLAVHDKVKSIKLKSYQYYIWCGGKSSSIIKFDSISSNVKNPDEIVAKIKDKTVDITNFTEYINKNLVSTYKYEQPKEEESYIVNYDTYNKLIQNIFGPKDLASFIPTQSYIYKEQIIDTWTKGTSDITFKSIGKEDRAKLEELLKKDGDKINEIIDLKKAANVIRVLLRMFLTKGSLGVQVYPKIKIDSFYPYVTTVKASTFVSLFSQTVVNDFKFPTEIIDNKTGKKKDLSLNEFEKESMGSIIIQCASKGLNEDGGNTLSASIKANGDAKKMIVSKLIDFGDLFGQKFEFVNDKKTKSEPTEIEVNKNDAISTFDKFYQTCVVTRPTRATGLNPDSSRSHLVIDFEIESNEGVVTTMRFIDLAGNEKADENIFDMRSEGNGIVASLYAIKDVMLKKQSALPDQTADTKKDTSTYLNEYKTENKKSCVNQYVLFYKIIEDLLADQGDFTTTVAMYLNIPKFLLEKEAKNNTNNINKCEAISGSLDVVTELMKGTAISAYVPSATTKFGRSRFGSCKKSSNKSCKKSSKNSCKKSSKKSCKASDFGKKKRKKVEKVVKRRSPF